MPAFPSNVTAPTRGIVTPEQTEAAIRALLREKGWSEASLGPAVSAVSTAYNVAGHDRGVPGRMAARLGFFLPRDILKVKEALRPLALGGRGPLRVLDLGAGLGTATLAIRELAPVREALLVDQDEGGLTIARSLLGDLATVHPEKVDGYVPKGLWDLIVVSQVLSELDPKATDRADRHATWVATLLGHLSPGGALLLVEPALRDRTRHLHAVRDRLVAAGHRVFAPCPHQEGCPALKGEKDWCHEDRPVDLPAWLHPVARAAGLHREGLSFSYLLFRADGANEAVEKNAAFRVVSGPLVSKGKREYFLCGEFPGNGDVGTRDAEIGDATSGGKEGTADDLATADRRKVLRQDRHRSPENAAWDDLQKGDLVAADVEDGRIGPASRVERR